MAAELAPFSGRLAGSLRDTLGIVIALQTLPVLLLGPYGGVIADRVDKRRLMVVLQAAMGVQALILGVLTVTGAVRLWEIVMQKEPLKTVFLGLVLGLLVSTAPNWMNREPAHTYDAPWVTAELK